MPVVASGVGGLLTLVDHGETGFLVHDRDPRQYAEYISEILDHPDTARLRWAGAALPGHGSTRGGSRQHDCDAFTPT